MLMKNLIGKCSVPMETFVFHGHFISAEPHFVHCPIFGYCHWDRLVFFAECHGNGHSFPRDTEMAATV